MPLNELYRVSNEVRTESQMECSIGFNADHDIFKGHFPGNPIVPGICTMAIIKNLLETALNRKLFLTGAKSVKFLALIDPAMTPKAVLIWKETDGQFALNASLLHETAVLFKFSASYRAL